METRSRSQSVGLNVEKLTGRSVELIFSVGSRAPSSPVFTAIRQTKVGKLGRSIRISGLKVLRFDVQKRPPRHLPEGGHRTSVDWDLIKMF